MTIEVFLIALAVIVCGLFLWREYRNTPTEPDWRWEWSPGAMPPIVGDTVTAPLQGECSMLLNYAPGKPGRAIRIEWQVTGGPFRYAEPEDEGKPVWLELILVRKGNDWTAGTPDSPSEQANFRQYHTVGPMEEGGWQSKTVPLVQSEWRNVWGRNRHQGLAETLEALDAIGLRWRHGMVTDDPAAKIEFRLEMVA